MSVRAKTRNEVRNIGLPNEVTINALGSVRRSFTAGIAISNYNHSDWQPRRERDVQIMLEVSGGRWSWNPIPVEMVWVRNNKTFRTAAAIHAMPHGNHLHGQWSFRIAGSKYQLNAEGNAGHFCLHYIDSMQLAIAAGRAINRNWFTRMQDTVREAERILTSPASNPSSISTPPSTPPQQPLISVPPTMLQHVVAPGDTFTRIKNNFGLTTQELLAANPNIVNIHNIRIGQVINIPTVTTTQPAPSGRTHMVQPNETWTRIANKHGVSKTALQIVNPQVLDINKIRVGEILNIPAA